MTKEFLAVTKQGKILRINLSEKVLLLKERTITFIENTWGSGFIAYFLLNELEPGMIAKSENKIIFALGPLTERLSSEISRNAVGAKSPLSGPILLSHR